MGSDECCRLQLRTTEWLPSFECHSMQTQLHIHAVIMGPPQPFSPWWGRMSRRGGAHAMDHDGDAFLVLATLVDRVNCAYYVLKRCEKLLLSHERAQDERHKKVEKARSAAAAAAIGESMPDNADRIRQLQNWCFQLRRFVGSHVQLSLAVMDFELPVDRVLLYGRDGSADMRRSLSTVQLFYPTDNRSPVENNMPDLARSMHRLMLDASNEKSVKMGAFENMLRLTQHKACFPREFPSHVAFTLSQLMSPNLSEAELFEPRQCLAVLVACYRVSLFGGYPHARATLSFEKLLRTEYMFERMHDHPELRMRVCLMIQRYEKLTLCVMREAVIAAARRDLCLRSFMMHTFPTYETYEQTILKSIDAARIMIRHGELKDGDTTLGRLPAIETRGGRFKVARRAPEDFVRLVGERFKHVSTDTMTQQLMGDPFLTSVACPWLPEHAVLLLLSYVQTLPTGQVYEPEMWFGNDDTVDDGLQSHHWHRPLRVLVSLEGRAILDRIYKVRNASGAKDEIQKLMRCMAPLDYAVLSWFYYLLRKYNGRQLMPLDRQYANDQQAAAVHLYSLQSKAELREHHLQLVVCTLLGCGKIKSAVLPRCGKLKLLGLDNAVVDIATGETYCSEHLQHRSPMDREMVPLLTTDQRTQLGVHHQQLAVARTPEECSHARAAMRNWCSGVARTLLRLMRQRPCDVQPVTKVPIMGYMFYMDAQPGITMCTNCGHPTNWAPSMYGVNGFTCTFCDFKERQGFNVPRCFVCSSVVHNPQLLNERSGGKHNSPLPTPIERMPSMFVGSERRSAWSLPSVPSLGVVNAEHSMLPIYDEQAGRCRVVSVCDMCDKWWVRKEAYTGASVQDLRYVLGKNGTPDELHYRR
jgi:hypothetical protein